MIAFFSKKLSSTNLNYTANDREVLAIVKFLERFICYLEGSTFKIITDNQVLEHLFSKPEWSREGARWLETIGNFKVFPIILKRGKIHVRSDALSRVLNGEAVANDIEVPYVEVQQVYVGTKPISSLDILCRPWMVAGPELQKKS